MLLPRNLKDFPAMLEAFLYTMKNTEVPQSHDLSRRDVLSLKFKSMYAKAGTISYKIKLMRLKMQDKLLGKEKSDAH